MQCFDAEVWRQRAWDRFRRAVRAKSKRRPAIGAEAQWVRDAKYIEKLKIVVDWCEARQLLVIFGRRQNGVYDANTKEIRLACRASPEKQLYYLLHECGHHLIGMKEHHERFGMGYPQTDPEVTRTYVHKLACLEEEFEAWHRGRKLARRLSLDIDEEEFDKLRLECLRSYVSWAARRSVY